MVVGGGQAAAAPENVRAFPSGLHAEKGREVVPHLCQQVLRGQNVRQRLVTESSYLSAVDNIREELEKFGSVYADRLTLVAQDGTVLYDNRTNASEMENHAVRPEIAAAEKNGTGEDNRLSETFSKQTFYYAVRLKNGDVLRISATADSVFGELSNASP